MILNVYRKKKAKLILIVIEILMMIKIKELELKRIENDLLNTNKYADLYKVCYKLLESLND